MRAAVGASILEPVPRLAFRLTRRVILASVCALVAHAAAYGTLVPHDGMHGYLGWYEPLVAALSLAAIAGLLLLLAAALVAHRRGRRLRLPGAPLADRPLGTLAVQIAVSGLAYLIAQESLERSIADGGPRLAAFAPGQWLVVLVVLVVTGFVLALALRLAGVAVRAVLGRVPAFVSAGDRRSSRWSVVVAEQRRSRPLAVGAALRAPPALLPA